MRGKQLILIDALDDNPVDIDERGEIVDQVFADPPMKIYRGTARPTRLAPPVDSMTGGASVPLDVTGHELANIDMANTTLETYEQDTECLECHRFASIAEKPDDSHKACNDKDAKCASDLSFIFDEANWSPTGAK